MFPGHELYYVVKLILAHLLTVRVRAKVQSVLTWTRCVAGNLLLPTCREQFLPCPPAANVLEPRTRTNLYTCAIISRSASACAQLRLTNDRVYKGRALARRLGKGRTVTQVPPVAPLCICATQRCIRVFGYDHVPNNCQTRHLRMEISWFCAQPALRTISPTVFLFQTNRHVTCLICSWYWMDYRFALALD